MRRGRHARDIDATMQCELWQQTPLQSVLLRRQITGVQPIASTRQRTWSEEDFLRVLISFLLFLKPTPVIFVVRPI